MAAKLLAHVRQQWMGALALLLVLTGGTAYALDSSNTVFTDDIVNGEVKALDIAQGAVTTDELANGQVKASDIGDGEVMSAEIANGQVLTADIGAGQVRSGNVANDNLTGGDIAPNSIRGADIDESTLSSIGGGGPAGGDLTGSYPDPLIGPNAVGGGEVANNSLKGADVDEASLGRVPSAVLGGIGRNAALANDCDPEDGQFIVCAATEMIDVPPGARALVIGDASAHTDAGANLGIGDCQLSTSATGPLTDSRRTFKVNDSNDPERGTLFGITEPLRPGLTQFGTLCQDATGVGGGIRWLQLGVSVLLISDS